MSKAVLVMDMPKSCYHCPLGNDDAECDLIGRHVGVEFMTGKPKWCPLRPMPEKKQLSGDVHNVQSMAEEISVASWNACIDAITTDQKIN